MPPRLDEVLSELDAIAPLALAADWDNVGLLLEPLANPNPTVRRVLLTIELSERVVDEALEHQAQLVVAYHPPIFHGLKRLTPRDAEGHVLLRTLEGGLAVYSPHTALDAVVGGVNDWLAEAIGPGTCKPVVPSPTESAATGWGRQVELAEPVRLTTAVERIKRHLGLALVRVAASERHSRGAPIRSFAVCAGAGGSVLAPLHGVDLLLTGEMRHHDVREQAVAGTSVVLCDHTNTERGYLPHLAALLQARMDIAVQVSQCDRDPLQVV